MGKNKLRKFAEMDALPNVFQPTYTQLVLNNENFDKRGKWHEYFGNGNPIVLELGCGRGEYAVGLAQAFPNKNFIGIDIKGSRMWTGATEAHRLELKNCAFIRTSIEAITHLFAPSEVNEIWITFADPQMKKVSKRLTGTSFLAMYSKILTAGGIVHLKTDSNFLYTYTLESARHNRLNILAQTDDLYATQTNDPILNIRTYYEQQWLARGLTIKYLSFQLQPNCTLEEPDVDIPYDEYRSYGRSRRSDLNIH